MKRIFIVIAIAGILGLIISFCYNNFFYQQTILGSYANTNYKHRPFKVEIPYVADTLTLYNNNRFKSNYWGNGTYKLSHTISGTEIELYYKYEFGKAGYQTSIKRLNWGSPKIILDESWDHYYEKIETK